MRKIILTAIMFMACAVSFAASSVPIVAADTDTTNTEDITYTLTADAAASTALDVSDASRIVGFTNSGSIHVEKSGPTTGVNNLYGIYYDYDTNYFNSAGTFSNTATILLENNNNIVSSGIYTGQLYGMYFYDAMYSINNSGNITIRDFNASDMSQDVRSSDLYGIYAGNNVSTLISSGTINILNGYIAGFGASAPYYLTDAYGIYVNGTVDSMTVSGGIDVQSSYSDVTLGIYNADNIYGISYSGGSSFANSADISAGVYFDNMEVDNGNLTVSNVYGIYSSGGITSFTNNSSGSISAEVSLNSDVNGMFSHYIDTSSIYGVYVDGTVTGFTNNGTLSADVNVYGTSDDTIDVNGSVSVADVVGAFISLGGSVTNTGAITADTSISYLETDAVTINNTEGFVSDNGLTNFYNTAGTIRARNVLTDVTVANDLTIDTVYGAVMSGNVETFSNTGSITAVNSLTNVAVGGNMLIDTMYGVIASNNTSDTMVFSNSSVIGSYVTVTNADVTGYMDIENIYGADIYDPHSITNLGTMTAAVSVSDSSMEYGLFNNYYGLYAGADVPTFSNIGTISAAVTVTDAEITGDDSGNALRVESVYGAYINGAVDTFTNNGTISSSVTLSGVNSTGGDYIALYDIDGVYIDGNVDSFVNNSNIRVSVNISDSTAYELYVSGLYGIYYNNTVTSIDNNGTISFSVSDTGGNYISNNSISSVYTIYPYEVTDITNDGTISLSVASDSVTDFDAISPLYLYQVDNFTNNGNIRLTVNGASGSTTSNVSAMEANYSTITINNPGEVYIESNIANADIRTLNIVSSDVTFGDHFTVAAGGFEGSENVGAIYVDSHSSLNLNDSILGVTMNSHLALDTAYKVIENDGGTVDGTFSGLRPFANTDYTLSWATSERG